MFGVNLKTTILKSRIDLPFEKDINWGNDRWRLFSTISFFDFDVHDWHSCSSNSVFQPPWKKLWKPLPGTFRFLHILHASGECLISDKFLLPLPCNLSSAFILIILYRSIFLSLCQDIDPAGIPIIKNRLAVFHPIADCTH